MVWAGFSSVGKLRLAFISHRMKSLHYQRVLRNCLMPFYRLHPRNGFVFMQDNAPIHVSRSTRAWLGARNVPLLEWPACSPDLNPIENLWGIIVRRIYANNRQYPTVEALKDAIWQSWIEIDQEITDNLVLSMDNRLFQVINRNGGPTDY